jgi:hypothetical protein
LLENLVDNKNINGDKKPELTHRIEPNSNMSFRGVFARDMAASTGRAKILSDEMILDLETNAV